MDDSLSQEARILSNDLSNEATAAASNKNYVNLISSGNSAHHNITNSNIAAMTTGNTAESLAVNLNNPLNMIQDFSGYVVHSFLCEHTLEPAINFQLWRFVILSFFLHKFLLT